MMTRTKTATPSRTNRPSSENPTKTIEVSARTSAVRAAVLGFGLDKSYSQKQTSRFRRPEIHTLRPSFICLKRERRRLDNRDAKPRRAQRGMGTGCKRISLHAMWPIRHTPRLHYHQPCRR
jgi:hypothetical protein